MHCLLCANEARAFACTAQGTDFYPDGQRVTANGTAGKRPSELAVPSVSERVSAEPGSNKVYERTPPVYPMAVKSYTQSFFLEGPYADDVRGSVAVDQVAIMSGMTTDRPGYKGSLEAGHLPNYSLEMEGGSYKLIVAGKARHSESYMDPATETTVTYLFRVNNTVAKEADIERRKGHPRRHTTVLQSHDEEEHGQGSGRPLEQRLENGKPDAKIPDWGDPRALEMHVDC